MDTIHEYLDKTKSAAQKIFEGIDSYLQILEDTRVPALVYDYNTPEEEKDRLYAEWHEKNIEKITKANEAEKKFINESFALSTLCGSLLQLAEMAILLYSTNKDVAQGFEESIKSDKKKKFCIGREVRGTPIGLIIYAGRNQHNHINEKKLNDPTNVAVFENLSSIIVNGKACPNPAFDLKNIYILSYASNITSILKWIDYEAYEKDLLDMLDGR